VSEAYRVEACFSKTQKKIQNVEILQVPRRLLNVNQGVNHEIK
jgi:hypothetical protein